jgi:hypothetical protein
MVKVGINLTSETAMRLRRFALERTGSMKGLSKVAEEAVIEYLDRHENKAIGEQENPIRASLLA